MRKRSHWGLFIRSFLLLSGLMLASLLIWSHVHRNLEIEPRARDIAQQIVTALNITRSAVVYSAPIRRRYLLMDLATNEGIRIYPRSPGDRTEPMPDTALMQWVATEITERLGPGTQIKWSVNNLPGIWVSFDIDNDSYWVVMERARAERNENAQWLGWLIAALLLSLTGAAFIVAYVNRPLSLLIRAIESLAGGRKPERLPENRGVDRIRDVYASFNRMVDDLERAESDRNFMLAGISHDLRTPLSRMRLELEMLDIDPQARNGIDEDLSQITHILRQFMDYAQPVSQSHKVVNASEELAALVSRQRDRTEAEGGRLQSYIDDDLLVRMNANDLVRVISNLLDNALKYGHAPGEAPDITVSARREGNSVVIEVCDRGPGIPTHEYQSILRPFVRGEAARTDTGGAGLGMAIVHRLVTAAGGLLELRSQTGGGLCVHLRLPRHDGKTESPHR